MSQLAVAPWLRAGIEDELRRYHISRARIEAMETLVAVPLSSSVFDPARLPAIDRAPTRKKPNVGLGAAAHKRISSSDPTFQAVAVVYPRNYAKLLWICKGIGDVLANAPAEWLKVTELYYWQQLPHWEVAEKLSMSEDTLRRVRYDIVGAIAYRLGLVKPRWWMRIHVSSAVKRVAWRDGSDPSSRENNAVILPEHLTEATI